MRLTSAEAAKLLRKLNEDKNILLHEECIGSVFNATLGEDIDSVRPEYDYDETQKNIKKLDKQILILKHEISRFNLTHTVGDTGLTIDQVLVYIPQLTTRKNKLYTMSLRLAKERANVINFGKTSTIIDYTYANYDVKKAKEEYISVCDELAKLQTSLDLLNNTEYMEVDF